MTLPKIAGWTLNLDNYLQLANILLTAELLD